MNITEHGISLNRSEVHRRGMLVNKSSSMISGGTSTIKKNKGLTGIVPKNPKTPRLINQNLKKKTSLASDFVGVEKNQKPGPKGKLKPNLGNFFWLNLIRISGLYETRKGKSKTSGQVPPNTAQKIPKLLIGDQPQVRPVPTQEI